MTTSNFGEPEATFTYGSKIESISDILDIVSRPFEFLDEIIDPDRYAPLGRTHPGTPRPFPHGIWFRGQSDAQFIAIPSVFRTKYNGEPQYFDEREMFTDVRLRASKSDLRGLNNLELMCLMQHHALPTRLLDWTESPLVAAFFAASAGHYKNSVFPASLQNEASKDCALYVINAYRLNACTNLSLNEDSRIFQPQDMDTVIRSIMAEHSYINNVFTKIQRIKDVVFDRDAEDIIECIIEIENKLRDHRRAENFSDLLGESDEGNFYHRMCAPIAVMPKRNHPRMVAQLSCFTVHGGKTLYGDVISDEFQRENGDWNFIPRPIHLYQAPTMCRRLGAPTPMPFIKKFIISASAIPRIMSELDRLGVSEALIYQDMENLSNFAKRRWATVKSDREIMEWERLKTDLISRST